MKKLFFLLCFTTNLVFAQDKERDSLKYELANAKDDTTKVRLYSELILGNPSIPTQLRIDDGLKGYDLAKSIHFDKGQIECGLKTGFIMVEKDYFKALSIFNEIKPLCEKSRDTIILVRLLGYMAYAYNKFDTERALYYFRSCLDLMLKAHVSESIMPIYTAMGYCFKDAGMLDSALLYLQKGYPSSLSGISPIAPYAYPKHYGDIYYKKGEKELAMSYYRQSIAEDKYPNGGSHLGIALIFKDYNQLDSSRVYAKEGLRILQSQSATIYVIQSAQLLSDLYKDSDPKEALKYLTLATSTKDSLFNQEKVRQVEKLYFDEKQNALESQRLAEAKQNTIKLLTLLGILGGVILLSFILYRNNRQKQKANAVLEKTLSTLKSTQAQLIQKEKLASLGELTAGIAHEIQNPLNFVNNFSELSVDLVKDLKDEIEKTTQDKEYIGELFDDLSQNQEKINHHGKRASGIVKGMLEHSRTSTGVKELTDINKLADEYLRLSYHGLRAKDNSFNADFSTDFDPNLPNTEVIPQDMGRVLLNLINNAFYAVNQRANQIRSGNFESSPNVEAGQSYTPSVFVSTKQAGNAIEIRVKDNGIGMSEATKSKVFQPFFTTKPTGQGTGLGLSLAYDIITKGHSGILTIDSTEGIGSEFVIYLPLKNIG